MRVPTSFSFLVGNTVSFTFLSFSFDPCCPCLQEYIRRQLEEEQRQLEILQQQLLQEQALLLVNGRPRPRLPLSARVASACARVHPCPLSASCRAEMWGTLLSPPDPEPPVPLRGREHASIPPPPLRAVSPRGARLSLHASRCIPCVASACLCLCERSSPLLLRNCEGCWQHVGAWSSCRLPASGKLTLPCGFSCSE